MFDDIYRNKRVLITGHTGFKGSWLALWLSQMGAKITGYSLQPPTEPNHFQLLDMDINSIIGDVRDADKLKQVFQGATTGDRISSCRAGYRQTFLQGSGRNLYQQCHGNRQCSGGGKGKRHRPRHCQCDQ